MALTYKKAGVDISKIKQSQAAIGKLIISTHKLQKKAKIAHGFGHYAGIIEISGGKLLATHTDGGRYFDLMYATSSIFSFSIM